MERKAPQIDKRYFSMQTYLAKSRIKNVLELAKQFTEDPDKKARAQKQLCKACHYSSRMAGQAFTDQPCACCHEKQTYSSTATDVFCMKCAKDNSLCKRCGADMELREGRRTWPEAKPLD